MKIGVEQLPNLGITGQSLGNVSAGSNKKYNLDSFVGIVFTIHGTVANIGYAAIVSSSGFVKELASSTTISMSASSNVLTISNSASTGTATVYAIILKGTITAQT